MKESQMRYLHLFCVILAVLSLSLDAMANGGPKKDENKERALIEAAQAGDLKRVQALIAAGADVNAKAKNGWTALMKTSSLENTQALIAAGADVNAKANHGWTALTLKSSSSAEIVQALIAAGADVNARDNKGKTVLDLARKNKDAEIIRLLEQAQASKTKGSKSKNKK